MTISSLPYADKLNEIFYEGMDRQTSLYLYGSAATGHWVAGRSDLDLLVLVPREKLPLLGAKVRSWYSTPGLPILEGYALSFSGPRRETFPIEQFARVNFPSSRSIGLIDQWNIRNRSKHLSGADDINSFFADVSMDQLRVWALKEIRAMATDNPDGNVPENKVVLSQLIWSVSWAVRLLMLSRGKIYDSKREALQWLASEHAEIRDLVNLLLDDYEKSNTEVISINSEQSVALCKFCFGLLLQESKTADSGRV